MINHLTSSNTYVIGASLSKPTLAGLHCSEHFGRKGFTCATQLLHTTCSSLPHNALHSPSCIDVGLLSLVLHLVPACHKICLCHHPQCVQSQPVTETYCKVYCLSRVRTMLSAQCFVDQFVKNDLRSNVRASNLKQVGGGVGHASRSPSCLPSNLTMSSA